MYDQKTGTFEFHAGPIFANIVLADEINRASPKTQSALLEVMEEGKVTIDGVSRQVGVPFLVLATQNPVEQAGTYRLPEAQLDRFMMRASLGYPDHAATVRILDGAAVATAELAPVITPQAMVGMADLAAPVYVDALVLDYIARLVDGTRSADEVRLGVSIRGALALTQGVAHARRLAGAHVRHARRRQGARRLGALAPPDPPPRSRVRRRHAGGRHRPGPAGCRAPESPRDRMSLTDSRLTRTSASTGSEASVGAPPSATTQMTSARRGRRIVRAVVWWTRVSRVLGAALAVGGRVERPHGASRRACSS